MEQQIRKLEIISEDKVKWNKTIKSFPEWDVYYLYEYCNSLSIHGDGTPLLIYYHEEDFFLCYVVMQKDIAYSKEFKKILSSEKLFDWETPYGYGGPIIKGGFSEIKIQNFFQELNKYCQENGVVSQFIRFMPLTQNQRAVMKSVECVHLKSTIYMDTTNEELIFQNLTSKNRNMIRKAKNNGLHVITDKGDRIEDFIRIYNLTMDKNKADEYYYFQKNYFDDLCQNLKDNMIIFYVLYDEMVISAAIFFYNEQFIHYHLSGSLQEYKHLAPTNLLLYEVARWACMHKIEMFHLGGGIKAEDSLFSFKKQFNRNGKLDFYIGRYIFIQDKFEALVQLRKKADATFNENNPYLIKYRGN